MDWGTVLQAGAQIADKAIPYVIDNHWKHRQIGMDYDFAKNQIQWRVEDAKKAGIHPLYALGASPITPSSQLVGGQASGGLGFTEAFNAVTNSKYEKELQRQTLEMNQLKIDGQKMANQIAYLESVKPVRSMGQAPLTSSNLQNTSFENETLNSQGNQIGLVNKTADGLYRVVALRGNNSVLTLKPTQDYSDYASESMPESYRNNMLLSDEDYANEVADYLTNQYRNAGIISNDEYYVPEYNLKYLQYEFHRSKKSRFERSYDSSYFDKRKKELSDMSKRAYLRRNKPYYGE